MRLLARKAIIMMLAFLSVKIHTHALGHSFRLSWGNDWGGLNLIRKGMCLHIKLSREVVAIFGDGRVSITLELKCSCILYSLLSSR